VSRVEIQIIAKKNKLIGVVENKFKSIAFSDQQQLLPLIYVSMYQKLLSQINIIVFIHIFLLLSVSVFLVDCL
jgi:hypothetical protein